MPTNRRTKKQPTNASASPARPEADVNELCLTPKDRELLRAMGISAPEDLAPPKVYVAGIQKTDQRLNLGKGPHHYAGCNAEDWHEHVVGKDELLANDLQKIRRCDVFVAWVDENFPTSYTAITEIGMAKALNKRIVLIIDKKLALPGNRRPEFMGMWVPFRCGERFYVDGPAQGIREIFERIAAEKSAAVS